MRKEMRQALERAFEAPKPLGKQHFLKEHKGKRYYIGMDELILLQMGYIRKSTWMISAVVFLIGITASFIMKPEAIWALSSVMPFLALTIISEWMRSMAYGMFELEQATRFSFKSVVLARLGILGIVNFLLFLFCLLLGGIQSDTELLMAAVYLATPYLATVFLGLWVMRKTGFRESEYVCLGIAVAVSALGILMRLSAKILLSAEAVKWWGLLAVILLALVIEEFCNGLKKTEAYIWN